jgi:cation diffusion facilitator CzcD-associated flavoprotein CzcO
MTRTFNISEQPVGKQRHVRAIVIGAGVSGIAFTYLARKNMTHFDFTIYEKNEDVGGTWFEARYPGCACDIPSHSYTYSWTGNPDWSRLYVGRDEIFHFYKGLAEQYGVPERTKFRHMVVGARWLVNEDKWEVEVENLDTKETFKDKADVLFNLGGILNNYKWPEIKGLNSFKGNLVHSANWDESIDFNGKTVAVIGLRLTWYSSCPRTAANC